MLPVGHHVGLSVTGWRTELELEGAQPTSNKALRQLRRKGVMTTLPQLKVTARRRAPD
jgi:hypothetical protein